MEIENKKSDFLFADNPIWICVNTEREISHGTKSRLGIFCTDSSRDNEQIFEGVFVAPLRINASEIARSYAQLYPDTPLSPESVPCLLIQKCSLPRLSFRVAGNTSTDFVAETSAIVLPGGVSAQNLRVYNGAGTDPFLARFLNPKGNFFFTTRSSSNVIRIAESELEPLVFMVDSISMFRICDAVSGKYIESVLPEAGIYSLPLDNVRSSFVDQFGIFPSVFDIFMINGEEFPSLPARSCRVIITQSPPAIIQASLRYRNSLGVYERLALTGNFAIEPAGDSDSNELTTSAFDSVSDMFIPRKIRSELTVKISAETDLLFAGDLPRLMDLLSSEAVELVADCLPISLSVIPSTENVSLQMLSSAPTKINISLEVVDRSISVLPLIADTGHSSSPRIFSKEFSNKFN